MKTGIVFLFLMILLLVRQDFGQSDSSASVKDEAQPRILIAKGGSYLENTVASMIADSLPGFTVTTIPSSGPRESEPHGLQGSGPF